MPNTTDILTAIPALAELSRESLSPLASLARERSYAPGQMIASEGEPCTDVLWVGRGLARLSQLSPEGRENVLAYLGPGECLNLSAALDGGEHLATADAATEALIYAIPAGAFADLARRDAALSYAVATLLAREVRRLTATVKELALHPVRARLARFLLGHAENTPPQRHWTQQEIATSLGTVRDVVGRVLRAFADEGYIRRERGQLVVVDRRALEREANLE